jgi:hypothetical protein
MFRKNQVASACLTILMTVASMARADPIVNGDFSAGNAGFVSEYVFSPFDLIPAGVYNVGDDAFNFHPGAASFGDHTTGNGLMLLANGAPQPNTIVWQQTVTVDAFTNFVFTGWAASWGDFQIGTHTDPSPAVLTFLVNGVPAGAPFTLPASDGEWAQFSVPWSSGPMTSAVLTIVDANLAGFGNDFALDDLALEVPEPPGALVGIAALIAAIARRRLT